MPDKSETIIHIELNKLITFKDHPFAVREDEEMAQTVESVKEYGVIVPAIARPIGDGTFELISGHRRKRACELAGLTTMPVIVRDIDRDAATILMVYSMAKAIISALSELPSDAVKTITCDRCTEFAKRQTIEKELNCSAFFADLYCAWQKELTKILTVLYGALFQRKKPIKSRSCHS